MNFRCLLVLLVSMAVSPAYAWSTEAIAITAGKFTLSDSTTTFGAVPVLPGLSNNPGDLDLNDGMVDTDGLYGSAASPVTTFDFLGFPQHLLRPQRGNVGAAMQPRLQPDHHLGPGAGRHHGDRFA